MQKMDVENYLEALIFNMLGQCGTLRCGTTRCATPKCARNLTGCRNNLTLFSIIFNI